MKYVRKKNGCVQGGSAAFAVCSLFLLLGAAAGCFSGSHTGELAISWSGETGSFGKNLAVNLAAVGTVAVFGSSCIGFLLLPILSAAAGFVSSFVMTAAAVRGGWSAAFTYCGWYIAVALPVFTVLCTGALRASADSLRIVAAGVRPETDTLKCFVKMLIMSVTAAILLAVAAAAV